MFFCLFFYQFGLFLKLLGKIKSLLQVTHVHSCFVLYQPFDLTESKMSVLSYMD